MTPAPSMLSVLRDQGLRRLRDAVILSVVALGVSFLIPARYTAQSTLLPPDEQSDIGSLLSGLAGSPALSRAFGFESQDKTNLYLGILQSESLAGRLVERFELVRVYKKKDRERAREELDRHTGFTTTPEGFVRIEVTERDPKLAADLANAYVSELDSFLRSDAQARARLRREYLDRRLEDTRVRLRAAEEAVEKKVVQHGLPSGLGQDASGGSALAELVTERVQREVELGVLEQVNRAPSPRMAQLRAEIAQFEHEIAKVPPALTETGRLVRDMRIQERVLLVLTEERERSRVQELQDIRTVSVVDVADPPLHKSSPRRSWIAIGSFAGAFLAGLAIAWLRAGVLPTEP